MRRGNWRVRALSRYPLSSHPAPLLCWVASINSLLRTVCVHNYCFFLCAVSKLRLLPGCLSAKVCYKVSVLLCDSIWSVCARPFCFLCFVFGDIACTVATRAGSSGVYLNEASLIWVLCVLMYRPVSCSFFCFFVRCCAVSVRDVAACRIHKGLEQPVVCLKILTPLLCVHFSAPC